ncbi:hypothetical protein M404DRAFT_73721, partial [Pisolithus tinctorius Marx 270]
VLKEETVKSVWGVLTNLFQNCSHVIMIDLQRKLQESRCVEKGDVCTHFNKMCALHEQLAALGHYDHVLLAGKNLNSAEETILFDSGTSCHMSSYCSKFLDYKPIIPKPITAADNHTFHAIRKGNLAI